MEWIHTWIRFLTSATKKLYDRVRKRDGSDSEERPIKRARVNTGALLPPGNDEQNDPPKPEGNLNNYDRLLLMTT